ncbi:MAG: carboxypeptidase regulatory-like domain-containing protein, partial [Gemmatimonadetes bacterium]|nr:carboxypeptidase regulatory-like domain-containing protein [Gemmatimonadota bacterium]
AKGLVDFEVLPAGAWIVRRWWIQMPMVAVDFTVPGSRGTSRIRVVGIKEVGGEVLRYSSLDRTVVSEELSKGLLEGRVWDGLRQAPLAGATVFLSGTSYSGETDPDGLFSISNLPEGAYTAAFTHPRLDSLAIFSRGVPVSISPGVATTVTLGIPAAGADLATTCSAEELESGRSAVIGFVRDASTEEPIPGAAVKVSWSSFEGRLESGLVERIRELQTTTDSTGRYVACGVPPDTRLTVRAVVGEMETEPIQVLAQEGSPAVANLVAGG